MSASALLLNATSYPDSSYFSTANVLAAKQIVALKDETTQQPQSLYLGATSDLSLQATKDMTLQLGSTRTLTVADSNATTALLVQATDTSADVTSVAKDLKLGTSDNAAYDIVVGATTISQDSDYQVLKTLMPNGFMLDNNLLVSGSELVQGSLSVGNNVICQSNVYAQNYNMFRMRDSNTSMNAASLAGFAWVVNDMDQLELLKYASFSNKRVTKRVAVFGQNRLTSTNASDSNYLAFDELGLSLHDGTTSNVVFSSSGSSGGAGNPFIYNGESILALADSNVQITGHLLPASNVTYDLGSSTARFRDLYLSGQTINLGDTKLSVNAATSNLEVKDATNNLRKLVISELQLGDSATGDVITLRKDPAQAGKLKFEKTALSGAKTDLTFAGSGLLDIDASDWTTLRNKKTVSVLRDAQRSATAGAQWAASVDSPGNVSNDDLANAVAVDLAGNVYLAGHYSTRTVGQPASTVVYNLDNTPSDIVLRAPDGIGYAGFIVKYGPDGIAKWAVSVDSANGDTCWGMGVDDDGNVYMAGHYASSDSAPMFYNAGNVASGTRLPGGTGNTAYLAKYDDDGTLQWAARVEGAGSETARTVKIDKDGNAYVPGWYSLQAPIIYNGGGVASTSVTLRDSSGASAAYVIKFNPDGVAQWAVTVDGTGNENGNTLAVSQVGDVYFSGFYMTSPPTIYNTGNVASDLTLATPGGTGNQMFLVKYNTSGVAQWAASVIGVGNITPNGVAVDTVGNAYVCGAYNGISSVYNAGKQLSSTVSLRGTNGNNAAVVLFKFNTAGVAQWASTIDGGGNDIGYAVAVDASGDPYVTGVLGTPIFYNSDGTTASLPARPVASNGTATSVVKYNAAGFTQWRIYMDSVGDDQGWGIAVDQWGTIYVGGKYSGGAPVLYDTNNAATAVSLRAPSGNAAFVFKYAQTAVAPTYKLLSNPAKFVNGQQKFVLNKSAVQQTLEIRDAADTTTISTLTVESGEVKKLLYYDGWITV